MEYRIARICSTIGLSPAEGNLTGGHLSVSKGQFVDTNDLISANLEEQIHFVLSVLDYGSVDQCWNMTIGEFYRAFVRAYNKNKRLEKQLEKNK